jgi:6-phosphogluconolactonase/glucosamine-6-phosphate isomerase/deaminase
MALQFNYETNFGFTATEAYTHITEFTGNKNLIRMNLSVYNNTQARIDGLSPIGALSISIAKTGGGSMQEMYDALKQLPEFEGAVDA